MKSQLQSYLNRYATFSSEEIDAFYNYLTPKTFQKKEFLLKEGDICKNKFFIIEGLIRLFNIDNKDYEYIADSISYSDQFLWFSFYEYEPIGGYQIMISFDFYNNTKNIKIDTHNAVLYNESSITQKEIKLLTNKK